ncbi:hypothetical protein F5Y05DRAFT_26427 [Hypoxylon sp. FL0543]|nr:hypothetical protein F5Y05DRAFT_26427 [Hypoxylon sp. FL0543]
MTTWDNYLDKKREAPELNGQKQSFGENLKACHRRYDLNLVKQRRISLHSAPEGTHVVLGVLQLIWADLDLSFEADGKVFTFLGRYLRTSKDDLHFYIGIEANLRITYGILTPYFPTRMSTLSIASIQKHNSLEVSVAAMAFFSRCYAPSFKVSSYWNETRRDQLRTGSFDTIEPISVLYAHRFIERTGESPKANAPSKRFKPPETT